MEIWKPIKNYENLYEVSNLGRVKSLERKVTQKNRRRNIVYSYIFRKNNHRKL